MMWWIGWAVEIVDYICPNRSYNDSRPNTKSIFLKQTLHCVESGTVKGVGFSHIDSFGNIILWLVVVCVSVWKF